ncbi:short-subunit dehydrogenase [Jatrophihabitans sp. GAS493]|uniref:SDR family oxidoreductase n=1 Tax=Jatrophihabitans sp. GAS493 TaxID=1907575 RepID=UPI000BB969AC|nr:SDR family oxidoreductase [Jatrophihabitans sp. GAS493]SOD73835.1 short-subunit dehydrogenase [Jatrophihabitans sp. GAS493]
MADTTRVPTSDGITLSVREYGEPDNPTVVLIHGYPDTSAVWDGLVAILRPRYHVVTYDVRGAGASDRPDETSAYVIDQLVDDLARVIDAASPQRPVHLIAHDWGSIQGWHGVTDARLDGRIASYTSVSGPNLDYAGQWMRRQARPNPKAIRALLRQLAHSAYIGVFITPLLPELLWRSGLLDRVLSGSGASVGPTGTLTDKLYGLKLYRANMVRRFRAPQPQSTQVPVQVLAPAGDSYVGVELQTQAPAPWATNLHVRVLVGGHWVVSSRPEVVAQAAIELIDDVENAAPTPRGLVAARVAATRVRGDRIGKPFAGQLAVITGSGAGIGRATAIEFARRGADVIVADINLDAATRTATELRAHGVVATSYHLDVADGDAFTAFAKQVQADHGTPDIVVNNAGIGMAGPFLATTVADWDRIIDINLWGVIHGSRLFAAQMVARGEGGRIVNIASAAAYAPSRTYPAYATTKAAVLMLTQCLRAELARDNIGAVAICPGFINSDISRSTEHVGVDPAAQEVLRRHAVKSYGRRNYSPERAAKHIVDATAANRPVATITSESKAFLAMSRFTPGLARAIATVDLNKL